MPAELTSFLWGAAGGAAVVAIFLGAVWVSQVIEERKRKASYQRRAKT